MEPDPEGEEGARCALNWSVCGGPALLVWGPFSWPSKVTGAGGLGGGDGPRWAGQGWAQGFPSQGGVQKEQEEGAGIQALFLPSPSPKALPGTEARRQAEQLQLQPRNQERLAWDWEGGVTWAAGALPAPSRRLQPNPPCSCCPLSLWPLGKTLQAAG